MKDNHSRGPIKEHGHTKLTYPGKHIVFVLRLRESEQDLADAMVFFSMSAPDSMQQ